VLCLRCTCAVVVRSGVEALGAKLGAIPCGHLWTAMDIENPRSGLCGRLWTALGGVGLSDAGGRIEDVADPGAADVLYAISEEGVGAGSAQQPASDCEH